VGETRRNPLTILSRSGRERSSSHFAARHGIQEQRLEMIAARGLKGLRQKLKSSIQHDLLIIVILCPSVWPDGHCSQQGLVPSGKTSR